jgi:DNA-binding NarL/FixJ family response regulator
VGWFQRKLQERRDERQRRYWSSFLGDRTGEQSAENVAASDLRKRVPTGDVTDLARAIDALNERDKFLLARRAEGATNQDIARELFLGQDTIKIYIDRIVERLRDDTQAG